VGSAGDLGAVLARLRGLRGRRFLEVQVARGHRPDLGCPSERLDRAAAAFAARVRAEGHAP
jgi:hypothetical protein